MDLFLNRSSDELARLFREVQSRADLCDLLEIPEKVLIYYLYRISPDEQYKEFTITKRTGGERQILAPVTPLKIIQRKLNSVLQLIYRRKPSVHGFVCGTSIVTNARMHAGKRFVLNLDLEEFFPSINFGRVRGAFRSKPYGMPDHVATVLARICCARNMLPQGAPTSPIVSNMVSARMDGKLQKFAKDNGCHYTKYADDITFSTHRKCFPESVACAEISHRGSYDVTLNEDLEGIIRDNGFHINYRKVWFFSSHRRQKVTGLTVNRYPNVPRKFISQIRAMLHAWEVYGYEAAEKEFREEYDSKNRVAGKDQACFRDVVLGKLNYLRGVRGKNDPAYLRFYAQLAKLEPGYAAAYDQRRQEAQRHYLEDSVFVLDCEEGQGTAFYLEGFGLVTCAHALGTNMVLYKCYDHASETRKYSVETVRYDSKLDIALLRFSDASPPDVKALSMSRGDTPSQQSPIQVTGFPNYADGQNISIYPGVLTHKRRRGNEERFAVSAMIRPGNSGGPVLNSEGEVVGIAATGGGSPEEEAKWESGVIPIRFVQEIQ